MKKVCVCVMSRANYGRLKSVIEEIDRRKDLELQLIFGASFYNTQVRVKVDSRIQCLINSDDHEAMALTTGILLQKISHEFARLKPDIVLVHGDRYEVLACAIASSYMNIPLAHTEGGENTGCIDDKIRNSITQLSSIHFPVTETSKSRLQETTKSESIYCVGSPALDLLKDIEIKRENFILVLHHPNTSDDEDITELIDALSEVKMRKIWINPNVDAGSKKLLKRIHSQDITFVKDLYPCDYYQLLATCKCAIGNSSSFIKEGSFLGTPSIIVGKRQEGREHGNNVIFVDYDKASLIKAIYDQIKAPIERTHLFGNGESGGKIAQILSEV